MKRVPRIKHIYRYKLQYQSDNLT